MHATAQLIRDRHGSALRGLSTQDIRHRSGRKLARVLEFPQRSEPLPDRRFHVFAMIAQLAHGVPSQ